jgi:hypothetical protein
MTTAQMTERETLYRKIVELPDEGVKMVIQYIDGLETHEPNEETIAAFKEAENLDNLTTCTDLMDMLEKCGVQC